MKNIILSVVFLFAICEAQFAQVVAPKTVKESKITLIDAGGDTWYTIDTTVYYDNSFLINNGVAADSATAVSALIADSLAAQTLYSNELASYTRNLAARAGLNVKITTDSLQKEYWAERLGEIRVAIDTIIAN